MTSDGMSTPDLTSANSQSGNSSSNVNIAGEHVFVLLGSGTVNMPKVSDPHVAEGECSVPSYAQHTSTDGDDGSFVVEKVSKFIRTDYQNKYKNIFPYSWKFQPKPLKKYFTTVNLKPSECSGNEQTSGDLMYNIFDSCDGSVKATRVLLYGSPGIGKSTLCQKYVYDWANPEVTITRQPFGQFKVVVFLKLQDATGTLEQIMEDQVFCQRLTGEEKQLFFNYMRKKPEEVLFIFDGVNECNLDELADIKDILEDKSYRGVYLVATSRPEMTRKWRDCYQHFHAHFCLKGYSEAKVLEFIDNYSSNNLKNTSVRKLSELKEHIKVDPDLMKLARIPLFTPIICELWETRDKARLPITLPTMTKLLNCYVQVVITLFCDKNKIEWISHGLPTSIEEAFDNLGKLAWYGVERFSVWYTAQELTKFGLSSTCELGFLSAKLEHSSPVKNKGVHRFAHKSIQEFIAGKLLVKYWNTEMTSKALDTMLSDINKFHSILVFIAGLLSSATNDVSVVLAFLQNVAKSRSRGTSCLEDCSYGCRMQLVLECIHEVWQNECKDSDEGSSSIAKGILSLINTNELFKKIVTHGGFPLQMSYAEVQGLSLVVPRLQLTALNLNGILIQRGEAQVIAQNCLKDNCSLTSVRFSNCCLCPDSVEAICRALETMPRLKRIDLSCCNLGDKGILAIAHLLEDAMGTITALTLGDSCSTTDVQQECTEECGKLSREHTLRKIKCLSVFQEQCKLSMPSDDNICELIRAVEEETCELEEISLLCCHVGSLITKWLNAFAKKDSLREIRVHVKSLNESLRQDLLGCVKKMPKLEKLSVTVEGELVSTKEYEENALRLKNTSNGILNLLLKDHTHSVRNCFKAMDVG